MATQRHTPADVLAKFYEAETIYMSNPTEIAFKEMATMLSEDLKLIQTPALPYGGTYDGVSGFQRWSQTMSDLFDIVDVRNPVVFTNPESDRVLVFGRLYLRTRKTQEVLDNPFVQSVLVDVEAGRIKEIQPFYWDVHGLKEAVQTCSA